MQEEKTKIRPTSFDSLIKATLKPYYADLATVLLGERPVEVSMEDPGLAVVLSRGMDQLLHLKFKNRPSILLHFEFQADGDNEMPERINEYLGLVIRNEKLLRKLGIRPACVVLYLYEDGYRHDPGFLLVGGEFGLTLHLTYKVIKLWELDPAPILALNSPGLSPLVPLRVQQEIIPLQESFSSGGEYSSALARFDGA